MYLITVTIVPYRSDICTDLCVSKSEIYSTQMATAQVKMNFPAQIKLSRKKIRVSFKRSHEALQVRENVLLSRMDEIEKEYYDKTAKRNKLVESLVQNRSFISDTLTDNELNETYEQICSVIDTKIKQLTKKIYSNIEFEWDNPFETLIDHLGSVKLNGQTMIFPTSTFPPHVKPVVPDYKTKHRLTAYCSRKSSTWKSPGELNCPRSMTIDYKTGNIYIADSSNHRVQVFSYNGGYLFMFSEKMNHPIGICISQNTVFVSQKCGHCINLYELRGKLIKSVGSEGNRETQFNNPLGLDVSDRNHNIYVCDCNNHRIQILTEELKYHSMLGVDQLEYPRDVKVTRDRVLVLDGSDPCVFVFN